MLDGQRVLLTSAPGVAAEVITRRATRRTCPARWPAGRSGSVHAAVEYVLDLDLDAPAPAGPRADGARRHRGRAAHAVADPGRLPPADPGRSGRRAVGPRRRAAGAGRPDRRRGGQHLGRQGRVRLGRPAPLRHRSACRPATSSWPASTRPSWSSPPGVDLLESPTERWAGSAQVLEVEPWQLSTPGPALARARVGARAARALPPAVRPRWPTATPATTCRWPRPGPRPTCRPPCPTEGLVAADPGPAGLWIARAFPTLVPGSVIVPAARQPGFAAAAALVAALDDRPAIAVTTDPVDPLTEAVLRRWPGPGRSRSCWRCGAATVRSRGPTTTPSCSGPRSTRSRRRSLGRAHRPARRAVRHPHSWSRSPARSSPGAPDRRSRASRRPAGQAVGVRADDDEGLVRAADPATELLVGDGRQLVEQRPPCAPGPERSRSRRWRTAPGARRSSACRSSG